MNTSQLCPTEMLYRNHHSWLRNWLRHKLGCSHLAADFVHDTFVKVIARREEIREIPVQEPRAFLRVIAGGLVIDYVRRRSLEKAYLEALTALPPTLGISPEEQQILLESLQRIDAALDQLPGKVREAFLLSQIHGMTYADIALKMKLSERTIKRYMQQGFCQCIAAMF
jgi:RNA polymerase sigma-70 factor (ECF subfamily)